MITGALSLNARRRDRPKVKSGLQSAARVRLSPGQPVEKRPYKTFPAVPLHNKCATQGV